MPNPENTTEELPHVGSDDLLSDLCALLAESGMRMVFWVCPKGCSSQVVWNEKKTDATCQVCGCRKSDNDKAKP